jgi:hypothetical protein
LAKNINGILDKREDVSRQIATVISEAAQIKSDTLTLK